MGITIGSSKLLNTAIIFDNPVDLCLLSSVSCLALCLQRGSACTFFGRHLWLFFSYEVVVCMAGVPATLIYQLDEQC